MPESLLYAPILLPLTGAVLAAFLSARPAAWLSVFTCALTLAAGVGLVLGALAGGPLVTAVGGWAPPHGITLVGDALGASLTALAALLALAGALYSATTRQAFARQRFYHVLYLLLLMALGGVFLTGDLFNMYVFMELAILASFALVATADRRISAEVTFKYAVLAAVGSTMLLVGVALTYAAVGTLNLADIAARMQAGAEPPLWPAAAAILLFAFLLKGAIFPFHFWQPDAHSAAPAPISAMLSGVLVKICVYGVLRMQTLLFPGADVLLVLAPLGVVTALFGGLAALANRDLKRLLAYSTISNMGFILIALGWGTTAGWLAALVNTLNHAVIKAGLFLSGGCVAETLDAHDVRRLGGVLALSPAAAVTFGIGAIAIAGLPPLNGFWSKFTLVTAGVSAHDAWSLVAIVAASGLGLAYAARAFVLVFWGPVSEPHAEHWAHHGPHPAVWLAPLLLAALCVVAGLWPHGLMTVGSAIVAELDDPSIYIHAVLGRAP